MIRRNKMKKSVRIIILSILLLISVVFLEACVNFHIGAEFYIFENLDELENIENSFQKYGTVNRYDSPAKDKYLKDLSFVDSYAAYYECEEFEFEIFAYEFLDKDVSKEYFDNVTGKDQAFDVNFSRHSGITILSKTEMTIIDHEKAYTMIYKSKYNEDIDNFLSENFTLRLDYNKDTGEHITVPN